MHDLALLALPVILASCCTTALLGSAPAGFARGYEGLTLECSSASDRVGTVARHGRPEVLDPSLAVPPDLDGGLAPLRPRPRPMSMIYVEPRTVYVVRWEVDGVTTTIKERARNIAELLGKLDNGSIPVPRHAAYLEISAELK